MKTMAPAKFLLACLAPLSLAQDRTSIPGQPEKAPSQPVITVHTACREVITPCTTVVTREQFEHLVRALHPGEDLPAATRNNLAKIYAEYIVVEAATRDAGMEDTAQFREFMKWTNAVAASEYYRRKLQEKLGNHSHEEIHAYYQRHLADYEAVTLARILVPREQSAAEGGADAGVRMQAAKAARERLLAGANPADVQKDTWRSLGLANPPAADVGKRHRKDLLADEATEVFALNPGEITQVLTEPANYVVYKVLTKETTSEESLSKSISAQLTETKFREAMKALLDSASAELDQQYFETSGAAEPPRSPHKIVVPK